MSILYRNTSKRKAQTFCFFNLPFAFFSELQKMTLDVITSTAFGIEADTVKNGDSVWLQKVKVIFDAQAANKRPLSGRIIRFLLSK